MSQNPEQPETGLAFVDGRDALAFVVIRPNGETDDAQQITVEAAARGMSKAAAAYTLRHVADQFDHTALYDGDEPIPYKPTTPRLTSAERRFLTFALDRAADTMRNEDGFTDDDEAALSTLRDLAEVEQPADQEQPRRVLTDDEYQAAYTAARRAIGPANANRIGRAGITDAMAGALAAVGILAPPPEPDDETCTALYPDPDGGWWQCAEDPGHDDSNGHDSGEWGWPDSAPNAIPPRAAQ